MFLRGTWSLSPEDKQSLGNFHTYIKDFCILTCDAVSAHHGTNFISCSVHWTKSSDLSLMTAPQYGTYPGGSAYNLSELYSEGQQHFLM